MAIVTLVVWAVTAVAGVSLLTAGNAARRAAAGSAPAPSPRSAPAAAAPAPQPTPQPTPQPPPESPPEPAPASPEPHAADGMPLRPPPPQVVAPAGEHPLLEFSHPGLAITGLGFWFVYVYSRYGLMAWIAIGILAATMTAGLSWLAANTRAARLHRASARAYPPRLATLHGLAAAVVLALAVVSVLTAR